MSNIIRIDQTVPRGRFSLDNVKEIDSLKGHGTSQARHALPKLREIFLGDHAEVFIPFRKLKEEF